MPDTTATDEPVERTSSTAEAPSRAASAPPTNGPPKRSPRGPRNRRRVVLRWAQRGVLALLAIAATVAIVQAMLPKPILVDTAIVAQGTMVVTVDEDGKARVKDRYVVSSPLTGRVDRIELVAGDPIESGAILARIVPLDAPLLDDRSRSTAEARVAQAQAAKAQSAAQIKRARAHLEFAAREAKRMRRLAEEGSIPRQQLEQALLAERTAAADLDSARFAQRVADYEHRMARAAVGHLGHKEGDRDQMDVPSPVDGQVLRVIQQSEGVVQPGTPLLELGDPAALEIVVDVLTRDAVKIAPGAKVTIDRWGGDELEGRVHRVEPSAFTQMSALGVEEQRVNVLIDLLTPRAQWASLGDGYRVEAAITVWASDDALKVPASAVFRHEDGWGVFRVEAGVARLRPVAIGERNSRVVEVTEGLATEDEVILHPSDRVEDGAEVASRSR